MAIEPTQNSIESVSQKTAKSNRIKSKFIELGDFATFNFRFFKEVFVPPYEFKEVIKQAYEVGFKSLYPVSVTSFVIGVVLVLQSRPALITFGAGSYIPSMAAASLIREIGPLITALVCAGNIGSSICAELGSMKVTEQIDAMEVSGAGPFKFLVVTRVLASTLIIPVLVVHADLISLIGSFLGANIKGEISVTLFFAQVFEKLEFKDVIPSFIKSYIFGFLIGIISSYKGFTSNHGTEGVGKATNSAVVNSLLLVIVTDMIITQISDVLNLL
jgi:phospholipid/cholesterol/gamma-HCH transport system permease protein